MFLKISEILTITLGLISVRSGSLLTGLTLGLTHVCVDAVLTDFARGSSYHVTVSADGTEGTAYLSCRIKGEKFQFNVIKRL